MKTHIFLRLIVACSLVLVFSISSYAQAPPQNFSVDQLTSLATWDAPASGQPIAYEIYLGDSLLVSLDNNVFEYQINCLVYNENYICNIYAVYDITISDAVDFQWTSTYLYTVEKPFVEADGQSVNFSLKPISPCGTYASTNGLIGFNIYKNGGLFAYVPYEQGDDFVFFTDNNASGIITYCAASVYDLSVFGLNGEIASSAPECQTLDLTLNNEIPFMEDWQSGSFVNNNWTKDSDNWMIDTQNGNDEPCVKFHRTPIGSNYSYSLTSSTFDASDLSVGHIYLKFDLKLDDILANEDEFIIINIKDSIGWHTVDSISNSGGFDWTSYTYNIGEHSIGQIFQIAFKAESDNSFQTIDWFIDNIEVYRECAAPENLEFNYEYIGDDIAAKLNWEAPSVAFDQFEYLQYCDDPYTGYGSKDNGDFYAAIRWDSTALNEYENYSISYVALFFNNIGFDNLILKIWTGNNAENEIYSDTINGYIIGDWSLCELSQPIYIQKNTEYWAGFKLTNSQPDYDPMGLDYGPAVVGYGDKVKIGDGSWQNLTDLGYNNNWNIKVGINLNAEQNSDYLSGFNIYKKENSDTTYFYYDFVEFQQNVDDYEYLDYNIGTSLSCYKVNSLWESNSDECTSPFAKLKDNPADDEGCILGIRTDENKEENCHIFPNPGKDKLSINSENNIYNIKIYNTQGQLVISKDNIENKNKNLDISNLNSGIYFIKIQTNSNTITSKFIKQ